MSAPTEVTVRAGPVTVEGLLGLPDEPRGVVLFAHGSGSSRHSPRNNAVARFLQEAGLGTLLIDLLTDEEERRDARTGELRFDIPLLAERLMGATGWLGGHDVTRGLPIGCFGASTGAAAALVAAAELPDSIGAVVSRGGRPDLAGDALERVKAATLLIVGSLDHPVIEMNRSAMERLTGVKELRVVEGASHLFEEPGALEQVARLARDWMTAHLG